MKSVIVCAVAAVVVLVAMVVAGDVDNVFNFHIQRVEKDIELFKYLMSHSDKSPKGRLGAYSYKNCGDPTKELLLLKNLTLGPDPLSFPGDFTVSFMGEIKSTIDAPLKADVMIARKFGSSWVKIPCIGNIGSCNYPDLCQLLSGATCPPPFVAHNIPCKCPFTKGSYSLPTTQFEVDAAVFPAGDYHATANLTYKGQSVACVDLHATFD